MNYVIHERWYTPRGNVAVLGHSRPMAYEEAAAALTRWRRSSIANANGLSDFWLQPL